MPRGARNWRQPDMSECRGGVSNDKMRRGASEGEGAWLSLFKDGSPLPLRGKLGWMTPRAGVKTTPAIETRLLGPPIPSGGPFFLQSCYRNSNPKFGPSSLCGRRRCAPGPARGPLAFRAGAKRRMQTTIGSPICRHECCAIHRGSRPGRVAAFVLLSAEHACLCHYTRV